MATYFVTPSGDNGNDGLSEGNAWADPGYAASQLAASDVCWLKAGTYTLTSSTPGAGGPVVLPVSAKATLTGYNTTPGDAPGEGAQPIISAGAIASISIVSTNGTFGAHHCVSFVTVDGQSNAGIIGFNGTDYETEFGCIALNCVQGFDNGTRPVGCKAENCTTGFAGCPAPEQCVAVDCTTGFAANATNLGSHCLAVGGTTGFSSGFESHWSHCTAVGCSGDGFATLSGSHNSRHDSCLAANCGAFGFDAENADQLYNCAGFNNTSGNVDGTPQLTHGFIALAADPFVDAGAADYRPNDVVNGGAELRGAATPIIGQSSHRDIGALQHADSGGGGVILPRGILSGGRL